MFPNFLTHYFEESEGPFRSLSDLPAEEAESVQQRLRQEGRRFAAKRPAEYLAVRRGLEFAIRSLFIQKNGEPTRSSPHYFILGLCPWLETWYERPQKISIPLSAFSTRAVSFTYGDSFPAMRYQDGKPYRGQVYTCDELPDLINCYGLPQEWNADGSGGPERYIEAQVWEDAPLLSYQRAWCGTHSPTAES